MKIATRLPAERKLDASDADAIAAVRARLIEIGDAWRARHPFLASNQNATGMTIFLVASLGVIADAVLYVAGVMPWWLCIPVTAFWLSLLHELEHDLIHWMYFRKRRWVHNAMMFGVWFLRPSTINPWLRRRLHLHHHQVSGTESDLEERALTNGERWDGHRLLKLADSFVGMYLRPWHSKQLGAAYVREVATSGEEARALAKELRRSYFPLGPIHYGLWHLYIGLHLIELLGVGIPANPAYSALNVLAVVLLAPNALRTFCLHFVSSNLHYFGDVEPHNILQQTQVWTSKWLLPLHAFCFNFGGTHAIHHFLVRDPFYLRQAIARECQQVLREAGVRFDDYGTFRRANRFSLEAQLAHVEV
jgi:fatty acid desaturase